MFLQRVVSWGGGLRVLMATAVVTPLQYSVPLPRQQVGLLFQSREKDYGGGFSQFWLKLASGPGQACPVRQGCLGTSPALSKTWGLLGLCTGSGDLQVGDM